MREALGKPPLSANCSAAVPMVDRIHLARARRNTDVYKLLTKMSGIFISYRRKDTLPWAGRLFDGLSRCFGKGQVFMDISGGIPRGANFEKVLTEALAGCDALLALIGPEWLSCKRSDGRRRLEVPDDWVRNEIATGLRRGIPVVPVLLCCPTRLSFPKTCARCVNSRRRT
jgi:hypothetical protein